MQGRQACSREDADVARELITHHKGFNCNLLVTQDPALADPEPRKPCALKPSSSSPCLV